MSCPKCGKNEKHFCPPSLGEPGFYVCETTTDPKPPVPDRVIGALIPVEYAGIYEAAQSGMTSIDVWTPENGWSASTTSVSELIERIARLEAEKQEAHTEGWNDCVDAAAKACENQLEGDDPYKSAPDPSFNIAIETCRVAIQKLSKSSTAKQGDPS